METTPRNPVEAVTQPNPYPYYADLTSRQPLYYDQTLDCWVASSAEMVTAVLMSDLCRVRPANEPTPRSIAGSPAGEVFRRLVRMIDGEIHRSYKQAVSSALGSIDKVQITEQASRWARFLLDELRGNDDPDKLTSFMFQLPIYVMASLLGVPENKLLQTAHWTSDFVAGLAPTANQEKVEQGKSAADNLLDLFHDLLTFQQTEASGGLLSALAREAKPVGRDDRDIIVANTIGFLSQAYDATAGLIGNTLMALASHHDVRERVLTHSELLNPVIQEVLRYDPPIQNTRRFLAQDGVVAGQKMNDGDTVLVVLAAANRDPSVNPHPDRFDMFRENRRTFTFGIGVHACPGENLAVVIAEAALKQLVAYGIKFEQLGATAKYRDSVNARIPVFQSQLSRETRSNPS